MERNMRFSPKAASPASVSCSFAVANSSRLLLLSCGASDLQDEAYAMLWRYLARAHLG
jgi:hypothetical protein